jgi:hypothetical protein
MSDWFLENFVGPFLKWSLILYAVVVALFIVLIASVGHSAEITVKVSDADQQAFGNLPGAVDACVAGLQLRGDAAMCKAIAAFANEFGAKVKAAVPPPEKPAEK